VIAFDEAAMSALLALEAGDAVSLAGETGTVYAPAGGEPRASLDMVARTPLPVASPAPAWTWWRST
jgi:hypothetical protein